MIFRNYRNAFYGSKMHFLSYYFSSIFNHLKLALFILIGYSRFLVLYFTPPGDIQSNPNPPTYSTTVLHPSMTCYYLNLPTVENYVEGGAWLSYQLKWYLESKLCQFCPSATLRPILEISAPLLESFKRFEFNTTILSLHLSSSSNWLCIFSAKKSNKKSKKLFSAAKNRLRFISTTMLSLHLFSLSYWLWFRPSSHNQQGQSNDKSTNQLCILSFCLIVFAYSSSPSYGFGPVYTMKDKSMANAINLRPS